MIASGLLGLFLLFIGAVVLGGIALAVMYNSLIGKRNQVQNVFASLDALLKKRYDLLPNLVATVQQYMTHERETLTEITAMRAKATTGNLSDAEKVQLNQQMDKALGNIMVSVEQYPDLKANENFIQLQRTLNELEEQISAARRAYNATVTDYNNALEMFPTNMMASMMSLKPKLWFEATEAERETVDVQALFSR